MLIVVLNDNETYTNIEGCRVVEVDDAWDLDDIEEHLRKNRGDGVLVSTLYKGATG